MDIQWTPLTFAANQLGIDQAKLSRLVKRGVIQSQKSQLDARQTLVDYNQLKTLLEKEQGYKQERTTTNDN